MYVCMDGWMYACMSCCCNTVVGIHRYLKRKSRGNIYAPGLRDTIQRVVDSYLDCRARGMPEPGPDEPVDFRKRARAEQVLILKTGNFLDM